MERLGEAINRLQAKYGNPNHGNKANPLNEYLYIILSTKTTFHSFKKTYKNFKKKYPKWTDVLNTNIKDIESCIQNGGLGKTKAKFIFETTLKLKKDFGKASLAPIRSFKNKEMENYLKTLPGAGVKVAKCIMMYSFSRDVLPVDTHTYRISKRLGFIKNIETNSIKVQREIEKIIPKGKRKTYHVTCVSHGRKVCRDLQPKCALCHLTDLCDNYKENTLISS